jgi:RimJ/RimL family protein N-acetyltransferase
MNVRPIEFTAVKGRRISLRLFEDRDLDDMFEVMGNREVMRFSLSGPMTREETAGFISQCQRSFSERGYGLLAIVHSMENRVIGYCGLYRQEIDGREELEIGYRLNPKYWGQGFASEAASIVRDMGFGCLGRDKLISIIEPENKASIGVARKIGMVFERDYLFKGHRPVHIHSIRNAR